MKRNRLACTSLLLACLVAFLGLATSGCVTTFPIDEYNLARAAFESARDADAAHYAPALWFGAEQAYHAGQKDYADRQYGDAKDKFIEARDLAERAEDVSRLARHQSGESVP